MKKLLQFLAICISITTVLFSCSKEEPTPEPTKYTLTVSAGDGGNVSSTGGSYNAGSEVTITATPNSEYVFSGWSNGSTENPIKITVNSNQTLTANFTKRKYALSITIEGEGIVTEEIISSGKDYDSGTVVKLTANPTSGWNFNGWSGAITSADTSIELTLNEAKAITATFNQLESAIIKEDLLGQWDFYNQSTAKYNQTSITEVCNIHSLIFNQDDTYKLYTNNEAGICNYVIFGTYTITEDVLSLYVLENNENVLIGTIDGISTDEEGISANFNIDNICVQLQDGYEEASYTEGLTYIPDENLENWLVSEGWDDEVDGYMLTSATQNQPIVAVYAEDNGYDENGNWCQCYGDERFNNRLTALAGVEAFPNLQILTLVGNKLDSINISQNLNLEYLYLNFNALKKLDTKSNIALKEISVDANEVDLEVDVTKNTNLEKLSFAECGIESIDVSNNTNLEFLNLYDNNLSSINLSSLTKLKVLELGFNQLTSIDFSNNTLLEKVQINSNVIEGTVDVSMCNNLIEFGVGANPNLTKIIVNQNQFDMLNGINQPNGYEWSVLGVQIEVSTSHDSGGSGHDSGGSDTGGN